MNGNLWQFLCVLVLMAGLLVEEYVNRPTATPPARRPRRTAAPAKPAPLS